MSPTPYCLPVDALRRFDPTMSQSDLTSDNLFDNNDYQIWWTEAQDASDEFDTKTNNAQRLTTVGRGDSWEYHDATLRKHQGGAKVYLDHRNVLPFDYSEGDRIQIRVTRDSWKDITEDPDRWRSNLSDGILQIFTRRVAIVGRNRRSMIADNIRLRYRYGALGGTRKRAGQTNLANDATAQDTTVDVENAGRLPPSGTVLIGRDAADNNPEYITYTGADTGSSPNQLTGVTRGGRGTADSAHTAGAAVHYCPLDVRKAVSGRVATEFIRSDDIAGNLSTPDDNISFSDRVEDWTSDWEDALGKYSEAYLY
jgi:hypothetical protein